jgi:hypothetical protein
LSLLTFWKRQAGVKAIKLQGSLSCILANLSSACEGFIVNTTLSPRVQSHMSSVSDWPREITDCPESKGLDYKDYERTTSPVRVLSADMRLRNCHTDIAYMARLHKRTARYEALKSFEY